MKILQSRSFEKKVKRLGKRGKKMLDKQIKSILEDPALGQEKKGDLPGVFIHKFMVHTTQYLLSYRFVDDALELIVIGPHENYYRDLKAYLMSR